MIVPVISLPRGIWLRLNMTTDVPPAPVVEIFALYVGDVPPQIGWVPEWAIPIIENLLRSWPDPEPVSRVNAPHGAPFRPMSLLTGWPMIEPGCQYLTERVLVAPPVAISAAVTEMEEAVTATHRTVWTLRLHNSDETVDEVHLPTDLQIQGEMVQ